MAEARNVYGKIRYVVKRSLSVTTEKIAMTTTATNRPATICAPPGRVSRGR